MIGKGEGEEGIMFFAASREEHPIFKQEGTEGTEGGLRPESWKVAFTPQRTQRAQRRRKSADSRRFAQMIGKGEREDGIIFFAASRLRVRNIRFLNRRERRERREQRED
jgi:hypothetical protein